MAEEKRYLIENIYQGGYSAFEPVSTSGYFKTGTLGLTTDPRNANVVQEVSSKLAAGVKQIELEAVSPEFFDSVPKQQLEELKRLSKLTGIDVSVHGPVMDTTGITQQGFSELNREEAERKIINTIERSHEINPDGNIPVNFHSAEGIPGSQFLAKRTEKGERDYKRMIVVNRETGRMAPLETEKKYYPGGEIKETILNPMKNLEALNHTEWDNTLSQIEFNRQRAEEVLRHVDPLTREKYVWLRVAQENPKIIPPDRMEAIQNLSQVEREQMRKIHAAATYADQAVKSLNHAFTNAYKYAEDEEAKNFLNELSKKYGEILGMQEKGEAQFRRIDPAIQSQAVFTLVQGLEHISPKTHIPIEEFAVNQSSKTYGNAAFEAFKKFGDKSPMVIIENPPAGFALSTGEDLKNLVDASRKQFVERAVQEKRMSEGDANKMAKKIIGATLDVGHMNMLRKYGYTEEEIVKETEKVAPYLKHLHLSDNFGIEHTELPMGMGNVPIQKIMETLKKGGAKTDDMRKVIEAAQWWQHFKTSPFHPTLETMGSPIYSTRAAPYWSQSVGFYQDFPAGYGLMLPQINYETFGAGFSQLPTELGGQRQGAGGSRMSGRPME